MDAMGRLGGYLSAPFHPFGGAVDIVVVEQEDGTFKSSPWYVQFGKFQGVLKAREKLVSVSVNGVVAGFRMYLDSKGGAYFLREVDDGECGSSEDPKKIAGPSIVGAGRAGSLERAEITADLLEVRWSTSLATRKQLKGSASFKSCESSDSERGDADASAPAPTGFLEDFTLEEAYLDANAGEGSVGSNGDGESSTSRGVQVGGERRLQRVESIYCETYESFMDGLDESGGESGEGLRFSCTVSGGTDAANEVLGGEAQVIVKINSELPFPSSVLGCELGMDSGDLEDRRHCRYVEGGESNSVTGTDAETVPGTKVKVVVKCKTNEGPVTYVKEMLVDQIPSHQDPSLTNSFLIEEATSSIFESIENLRSQNPGGCCSTGLLQGGSCKNNDNMVASMNECNGDAFKDYPTNVGVLEKSEREKFRSSDLGSSELLRIVSVGSTPSDSITKESNSQDFGESSEGELGSSVEKPEEIQFVFSDLDDSKATKTTDTQPITLDSQEKVNGDSSEEKLGESTGMVNESHSLSDHGIQDTPHNDDPSSLEISRAISSPIRIGIHEQVDRTALQVTVESLPIFLSHEAEMNTLGANHLISRSLDSSFDNMGLAQADVPTNLETGEQQQQPTPSDSADFNGAHSDSSMEQMQISKELRKTLSDSAVEISLCRHLLYKDMGHEAAAQAFDAEKLDLDELVSLDSDIIRNERLVVRIGRLYFPWDAALPIISAIGSPTGEQILEPKGMITVDNGVEMDPQQSVNLRNNTWKNSIWPFSRTKSTGSSRPPSAPISTLSQKDMTGVPNTLRSNSMKKNIVLRKTPTSEQLASLNLQKGKNEIIFTFSSPMLGEQKVDAHIYLWKWNVHIVISDVDGTITKSDVLGQFMPLVGVDWSHIGVTHLFSAIKENGYELLFLSARAISQASLTRQFLFNLKQEGKTLPVGPVVISPDGIFPSLFREVIRRAPHEFKIACLEDIKALFPPHHNPFYAGFGNRDTDELSYVKVGIPKGKIFIINPKGEVAVERRVDRKSYTSLHTLVHDMFPPPSRASSSEQEDFNSWNFWRLPPPPEQAA